MRFTVLIILLFPLLGLSQVEKERKFIGLGLEADFNLFDEPTLSFEEFKSVLNAPEFFLHSSNAELVSTDNIFTRNGLRARFIFKGPDNENLGVFKKSRFVVGALYNAGNNYTFEFNESSSVRADTLVINSSSGTTQTLYVDTIFYNETKYSANSKNMGVFAEFLLYAGENTPKFSVGFGVAADMTLQYNAQVKQTLNYWTGLFDENGIAQYAPVSYNPATDIYSFETINYVYGNSKEQGIKTAFFIRPYIPVRLETRVSDRPKLSKFSVDINAKIGTEIQINPRASVNARMFYSIGMGLNYYL
jgi:hypothetical protein